MRLTNHKSRKLTLSDPCVGIGKVAMFPSGKAARVYMERIFPHMADCYVISADGEYPKNPDVRVRVQGAIDRGEELKVIVFGNDSLRTFTPKSSRILVMDPFLMGSGKFTLDVDSLYHIEFDEYKIIHLMRSFFAQFKMMCRPGSATGHNKKRLAKATVDNDALPWITDMLTK